MELLCLCSKLNVFFGPTTAITKYNLDTINADSNPRRFQVQFKPYEQINLARSSQFLQSFKRYNLYLKKLIV